MTLSEGAETMGHGGRDRTIVDRRASILYFALFPNALISLHPDYVMLHTLWPRAVDRTDVVCEWFFEDGVTQGSTTPSASGTRSTARTGTCASSRRPGCRAAPTRPGRYTTQEDDVHHFDVMVADRYAAALAEVTA